MRKAVIVPVGAVKPRFPALRSAAQRLSILVGARRRVQYLPAQHDAELDLAQRVRLSGEW